MSNKQNAGTAVASTALLYECVMEMGMSADAVIRQVLISADGLIDYRTKLNSEGVNNWLRQALNNTRRRKARMPSAGPLPLNYYAGEW